MLSTLTLPDRLPLRARLRGLVGRRSLGGFGGNLLSMGSAQMAMRVSRLATTVILTRALSPENFGLAAIVLTVYELVALFTRNGISAKVVQADAASVERVARTALTMTWIACLALMVIQALIAVPVALAFGDMRLALPIALMGLIYLATPLCNIQGAFLQREGRLGRVALAGGVQVVTDNILTAVLALSGFGMWAIILPKLLVAPIWVVIIRGGHAWRPARWQGFRDGLSGWRNILAFSRSVIGVEMMTTLQANLDNLLVGYFLGTAALGTYFFAFNAGLGITLGLVSAFSVAVYPHLCQVREDRAALDRRTAATMRTLGLLVVPIVLAQVLLAPVYVPIVFGEKWIPAIPVLMIICLSALPRPFATVRSQYLKALGRPDIELRWQAALTLALAAALLVATQFGIVAVALAVLLVQGTIATAFTVLSPRALGGRPKTDTVPIDPAVTFAVVGDAEGLGALRAEWDALWHAVPGAHVSQSFDWCRTGWDKTAAPRGHALAVVTGRVGGRLVLVWPLSIARHGAFREALVLGSGSTDYDGLLQERGPAAAGRAAAALAWLRAQRIADVMAIPFVAEGSTEAVALDGHAGRAARHTLAAPLVDQALFGGYQAYLAARPAKLRNELSRRRRHLDGLGTVARGFVTDEPALGEAIDWAIAEKAAWARRTGHRNDFLGAPEYRAFMQAMARAKPACGRLAVMTMTLDGRIIAAKIGTIDAVRFEGFVTIYDAAYAKWSPGSLLLAECLKYCFDNGLSYDFRIGEEDYKRLWATGARQVTTHQVALSRRGTLVLALRAGRLRLAETLDATRRRIPPTWRAALKARVTRISPRSAFGTAPIAEAGDGA